MCCLLLFRKKQTNTYIQVANVHLGLHRAHLLLEFYLHFFESKQSMKQMQ